MKMRTGHSTINWFELSQPMQERMVRLFEVAGRKSLYSWAAVNDDSAEVIMLDRGSVFNVPDSSRVIFVGEGDPAQAGVSTNYRLSSDFTVGQLIDVLDRLALVLMDANMKDIRDLSPDALYGLKRWVALTGPLAASGFTRAQALMTRKALTLGDIGRLSGLAEPDVRRLLRELNRLQVLEQSRRPVQGQAAEPDQDVQPVRTLSAPAHSVVGRLSAWLAARRSRPTIQ